MNKTSKMPKLLKWVPVIIAGIVAGVQTLGEQKQQARIDEMDERIANLEKNGES